MKRTYDAIVIGGGVIGAATLFHLAEFGYSNSVLLERNHLASGGTGRSCAIIRTHYSIPSNTQLALQSLEMFRDLESVLNHLGADSGFVNTGYLILAPEGDMSHQLVHNLELQRQQGAHTSEISTREASSLHPLLNLSDVGAIGYEPDSGYADPYLTTTSFVKAAKRRGAELQLDTQVTAIITESNAVLGVQTQSERIYSDVVISIVGPWTKQLIDPLGIETPLTNYRHTVLTLKSSPPYTNTLPIVKDLTVDNKMYFRPEAGMILAGTGDYGDPIADPDHMSGQPSEDLLLLQSKQIAHRVPSYRDAEMVKSWFGPYDITPDWNPVIDSAPGINGLYLAFGFSGHGFKLAPMVGRALARMALHQPQDADLSPYRLRRFAEGELLVGAYGAGSIS